MNRTFAIGDIHGCCETFKKLLLANLNIDKTDEIYFLGDYIDRGEDSKGVIDVILKLRSEGYQIHTLRGNHEQLLLDSMIDEDEMKTWLKNGGNKTLQSFGIKSPNELPEKYLSFFKETEFYIEKGEYIFVHAGLNFDAEDIFEDKEAMLWIRDYEDFEPALGNRILIHGHTPVSLDYILNQKGNCINIDGGCVYPQHNGMGNLIAYDLKKRDFIVEKNCE
ncbi:MAG: metallophosphoesterase family protein [Ferruginibacter sp.]